MFSMADIEGGREARRSNSISASPDDTLDRLECVNRLSPAMFSGFDGAYA